MKPFLKKWSLRLLLLFSVAFVPWYVCCLPDELFTDPDSTVLLDKDGKLLGAKIATDGQWRFSPGKKVPKKFETCLLEFEDRSFYEHYGISLRGIDRARASGRTQSSPVSSTGRGGWR